MEEESPKKMTNNCNPERSTAVGTLWIDHTDKVMMQYYHQSEDTNINLTFNVKQLIVLFLTEFANFKKLRFIYLNLERQLQHGSVFQVSKVSLGYSILKKELENI